MKKITFLAKTVFMLCFLMSVQIMDAQVEYRQLSGFGTRFNDVNDNGTGVTTEQYYDFATNTLTNMEAEATAVVAINNNGDVAGDMFYDEPNGIMQPAYRKDGTWNPIGWFPDSNPDESAFFTYDISPNSKYVVGQMPKGVGEYGTFLYDTETEELFEIFDPAGEAIAGYTVTDDGTVGGWLDQPNDGGTLRRPAYFNKEGDITLIPSGQLPSYYLNSINDINTNGIMVGDFDGQPFIYDSTTDEFTLYTTPQGNTGSFTRISDTGVVVGWEEVDFDIREAIIYHPILGSQPLYLKDVLSDFGVTVGTFDGRLGHANSISPDGNYVVGWVNGPPLFADGWIINFDGMLLQESDCTITCPGNIEVTAETSETSVVVDYEITFECNEDTPDGTELVLVNGLESGSAFPIGITTIYYRLMDGEDNVLDGCSFTIKVNDYYCATEYTAETEPITYVNFASIDNASSELPTAPKNEYFLDITGQVEQGQTYPMVLKGYTGGPFTNHFTVFIDWDQDGIFNTTDEKYFAGSINSSTGLDDIQALSDISVPGDAMLGITRMRIVKNYDTPANDPCGSYSYGQSEDYLIEVGALRINDRESSIVSFYPNPVDDVLHINSKEAIDSVVVYTVTGQKVSSVTFNATNMEVNVASLASGIYFMKVSSNGKVETLKVIKQ